MPQLTLINGSCSSDIKAGANRHLATENNKNISSARHNKDTGPGIGTLWSVVEVYRTSLRYRPTDLHLSRLKTVPECWLNGAVVERRSLTGELSLSCARPAADG